MAMLAILVDYHQLELYIDSMFSGEWDQFQLQTIFKINISKSATIHFHHLNTTFHVK